MACRLPTGRLLLACSPGGLPIGRPARWPAALRPPAAALEVWLFSSASALCAVYAEAARRAGGDHAGVLTALLQSRFFLLLLANAALSALAAGAWLLKVLLLGKLRAVESQAVSQRLRDAVFEACLALSIFPEHDNDGADEDEHYGHEDERREVRARRALDAERRRRAEGVARDAGSAHGAHATFRT